MTEYKIQWVERRRFEEADQDAIVEEFNEELDSVVEPADIYPDIERKGFGIDWVTLETVVGEAAVASLIIYLQSRLESSVLTVEIVDSFNVNIEVNTQERGSEDE